MRGNIETGIRDGLSTLRTGSLTLTGLPTLSGRDYDDDLSVCRKAADSVGNVPFQFIVNVPFQLTLTGLPTCQVATTTMTCQSTTFFKQNNLSRVKNMEIKFEKTYLEELFFTGATTDKKYRFQPQIIKKYRRYIMTNMKFGFTPTHPGEVLKNEIEYRKIHQNNLLLRFAEIRKMASIF